jgi:6-phosphogluconolactonase/glucosamine-6-phosphate isomerase/deaminase
MKYILTAGWDDGVADLAERLVRELAAGKHVLWLTSGGSNIPSSVQIMDNISAGLSKQLSVSLADERYGEPGHSESNWAQLMQAGFSGKHATLLPVLKPGVSFEQTIRTYNQLMEKAFASHDVIIAQLGIGPDGHVAGILPHSPATTETTALVTGYKDPPLTRITLTFPGLSRVTAAYVFAFGKPKQKALVSLHTQALPKTEQPAQILSELPEAYIYNDQVGEHV